MTDIRFHNGTLEQVKKSLKAWVSAMDDIHEQAAVQYVIIYYLTENHKRAFIKTYKTSEPLRFCCRQIVRMFKRTGDWQRLTGDFTDWAKKQNTDDPETLEGIVRIIYNAKH